MSTLIAHGVYVSYRTLETNNLGVMEIEYSGTITDRVVPELWANLMERTKDAPAVVLRVHRALTLYRTYPDVPPWVTRVCPGAVIARADQYEYYAAFARSLHSRGVVRGIFLPEHEALAHEWAEEEARSRRAKSVPLLPNRPHGELVHP